MGEMTVPQFKALQMCEFLDRKEDLRSRGCNSRPLVKSRKMERESYQPPLPADQVKPLPEYEYEGEDSLQDMKGKGRGRGRGTGRGGNTAPASYQNGDAGAYYDSPDNGRNQGRGRFRGRGRGRGFPGRGRGGFYGGAVQDNSNYNDYVKQNQDMKSAKRKMMLRSQYGKGKSCSTQ